MHLLLGFQILMLSFYPLLPQPGYKYVISYIYPITVLKLKVVDWVVVYIQSSMSLTVHC